MAALSSVESAQTLWVVQPGVCLITPCHVHALNPSVGPYDLRDRYALRGNGLTLGGRKIGGFHFFSKKTTWCRPRVFLQYIVAEDLHVTLRTPLPSFSHVPLIFKEFGVSETSETHRLL